ncbi:MAG: hypothetical protein HKO57_00615, partial [Akkermansiaceae bacterium]|nr:hypothetical protein [Akkermansiaceae bacterium]
MKFLVLMTFLCPLLASGETRSLALERLLKKDLWDTPITTFAEAAKGGGFQWLSSQKQALRATRGKVTLFGGPVGEVVVRSKKDTISSLSASLYNRGDDGNMKKDEFTALRDAWVRRISDFTEIEPQPYKSRSAVDLERLIWRGGSSAFLLEASLKDGSGAPEFLRLRLAPNAATTHAPKTANRFSLRSNLTSKPNGDIYLENVPMVDQGKKGYCAVASAERIMRYYGNPIDQHEMAQIAQSSAARGTSLALMVDALKKAVGKLNTRTLVLYEYPKGLADSDRDIRTYNLGLKEYMRDVRSYNKLAEEAGKQVFSVSRERVINMSYFMAKCDGPLYARVMEEKSSFRRFKQKITEYIDQGIPVAWALQLGMFKEGKLPQMYGGHMRLIIGYNER